MMTIHKLSAGDGYRYYTHETVTGDVRRSADRDLGDYYTAEGNPPGVWVGGGITELGVFGTVTEAQMEALYGEGLHPNADEIIKAAVDEGLSPAEATRRARLGRRFYRYDQTAGPLAAKIQDEIEALEARKGEAATADERKKVRAKAGAIAFRADFGRSPKDAEELARYISANTASKQQAVAGYDLVLRPPEEIGKGLFGAGDEDVCRITMECDDEAVLETIGWIEKHALATRTGINGVAQEDVRGGLVATLFKHYDNRLGEPLLHHHLVVANKVRGADGKWRSIDGKLLYAMGVAASEFYNQVVVEKVCARLGLEAEEREVTPGKRPVMGIKGFDRGVLQPHSKRTKDIGRRLEELLQAYRQQHGKEPGTAARMALIQQATLETRPAKKNGRSLAQLRAAWRRQAIAAVGRERVDALLRTAQAHTSAPGDGGSDPAEIDVVQAAEDVLAVVSDARAVWGERHVLAEARRHVVRLTRGRSSAADGLAERITERVLDHNSLSITPPDLHRPFAPLLRADGTSIYRRHESLLYTSREVLAAEDRVLNAARTVVVPALTGDRFTEAADHFQGHALDAGQRRLAKAFACSDRLVVGGIGPAGAGKTTALQLVRDAVAAGGGRLIPLAPSSRAAKVIEGDLDTTAYTLHGWLAQRDQLTEGSIVHRVLKRRSSKRRKTVSEEYALRPGDVIVVDEAGMAGTRNLARVVAEAESAGALVRLIGDPAQLGSIESGGLLRQLARDVGVVELEELHRFQTEGEGEATLVLRDGDPADAWSWYLDQGRVVGGAREEMLGAVFAGWQRDVEAGLKALMMADDAEMVRELNLRAQAFQLASGRLDLSRTARLRDELQAAVGDVIVTRKNQRKLALLGGRDYVKNGDQWLIERIDRRGNVHARHTGHGGRIVLARGYLCRHAELGYAYTTHRAQGITVDVAHGLITARTSREAAYVEATRGRNSNHMYVVTDDAQNMRDVLDTVAHSSQASISAHEMIQSEQERAYSIAQLVAEYTDVYARTTSQRLQNLTRRVLGPEAEMFIAADAWEVAERSLRAAEAEGWDLGRLIRVAFDERDFTDAEDPAAVLAWRIDYRVEAGGQAAERAARREAEPGRSRPLKTLSTEQLGRLLELAEQHRRTALEELLRADAAVDSQPRPVVANGLPCPAWPDRAHGHLTGAQLAAAIAQVRARIRRAEHEGDHETERSAAVEHALLRREQQLRRAMPARERMREDWQREPGRGVGRAAHQPVAATRAERTANLQRQDTARERLKRAQLIAAKIRAEQRLRDELPHGPAPVLDNSGHLPDWIAPSAAVRDMDTPESWRQHLVERRFVLSERLEQMGFALAESPPSWARVLGPVPAAGTDLREQWERTAAVADVWRIRHALADDVPGIGEQPADPRDAHAWSIFQQRIAEVGRRARASAAARHRPDEPSGGMRIAARTAENFQYRLLDAHVSEPEDREAVSAAAAAFAELALRRALEGQEPAEEWVEQIPSPDSEDPTQQEQWQLLVAALAAYRMLNQIDSNEPLGETPDEVEERERWAELHEAMTLFQRARVQQRLGEVRAHRDAERDRRGLAPVASAMPSDDVARGRRADSAQDEQNHHRRNGPNPGPRRKSGM
ncbi:MobF family relaxase [Streptomyces sp. NPDC005784]|uniref:MobF family relaxase n=1 Tax=Streptomyces sp. NPDC005784 TaxID=3364731 RepID=UPI0036BD0574